MLNYRGSKSTSSVYCPSYSPTGAMRFCEVLKIRVLNHLFSGAIAAK
ncbi:hypothetical protein [Nostoc sphaeroides]|uniref:Uncharacterized protein n=1 Tax=Nostoc sphaeroides CCNUC1 TaxID=2653204 RepID=A0A5P8WEB8_9NOSO|nr:hypothetical protein [Nostoc sphaeroides]QFS51167.1 hypothetical protein GXM_08661 [Nostoc sphaeroides CCNUC1]